MTAPTPDALAARLRKALAGVDRRNVDLTLAAVLPVVNEAIAAAQVTGQECGDHVQRTNPMMTGVWPSEVGTSTVALEDAVVHIAARCKAMGIYPNIPKHQPDHTQPHWCGDRIDDAVWFEGPCGQEGS